MKTIAIGADDAAYDFRDAIIAYLNGLGINVVDYSSDKYQGSTVYPDVAHAVAIAIKQGEHDRGILICGTGIGMSIVANKVPGVRAAQCHDTFSAERARKSNNAQIITLGARVIGTELGKKIVQAWLESEYEGGGSAPKVERIDYYEQQHARD
ncbi:ribose 5-phosphate isomerase B [Salmonella enterica]|uniref:Ribose 5-phosphate isomerase B n=2 Tax=Salmonella enterica subsp. arizonae TaxID=59203 RepID=A0A5Y3QAF4_SALER|nr:ribose 5-phosphate isomerase B [Salmonella enterica subsp. arizonae serovar 53:-:- str. SA20100345]EAM2805128.1 ribose 5-phosphate isomerase B [Salmonella enterica]EAO5939189.1 ribose 5-phosphate isomerase B [Salmonella enterica subsp. houtenae serovar 48:g,z51:-]EAW1174522.1 ribose 5-phosphate isomerase B [Salmonella enterica subsp. enterica]ECC1653667.1 ribose 5-phosphate isomerase B [Salmonella enterica subsp. arizonae]ECT9555740.1 ribose 5-phosphate isomerase B [Salmonella enterica subs